MYAPVDSSFDLEEDTAQDTACGDGSSFCRNSINSKFQTGFRSDKCSIQTSASDNTKHSNYTMWLPEYKKHTCEGSAFQMCDTTSRFGPSKVTQESFLQGRGQVAAGRECFASDLKFLPKDVFPDDSNKKPKCRDMTLFPQNTISRRSCGSISEVDMLTRIRPLPGQYQGAFVPVILNKDSLVPNISDKLIPEGTTLSNKSYPSWADIKTRQESFRR